MARWLHDFRTAFGKARQWFCPWPIALWVALRFAATGDSGRFRSHAGWRISRIRREDPDQDPGP